ncbi:MAG: glycosyltransferase family 1 protein [Alphaproteobacteria bacterium]|nr:glycosyltransferase family 1 protein [Alphaproteobacteria bacterium]
MAHIVMTDDGLRFDARSLSQGPLGGAETAFTSLAFALARRGHDVSVRNRCIEPMREVGIDWAPLEAGVPHSADLYIANRAHGLLPMVPRARRRLFWIHNPARYLLKWRYLSKLFRWKPVVVFSSLYHADTYPAWAPDGGRVVIPLGVSSAFLESEPADEPPPPRALFVSNPLRGLDWLLTLWAQHIHPRLPTAELHIFSGASVYGGAKAREMEPLLEYARQLADRGVVLRPPVSKAVLADEMRAARVLVYRGDKEETFCLAVAEAQAAGVPAVVGTLGCVPERVLDGETGFVEGDERQFADRALALLADDRLWRRMSRRALERQRGWGWDEAASAFEKLI